VKIDTWHGLTHEQWLALWDSAGWRAQVAATLREVATSGTEVADRMSAMQTWNDGVLHGALPPAPEFPRLMRDVMLEVSGGHGRRISRRRRRKLHDRLIGAKWLLQTACRIIDEVEHSRELERPAAGPPS
jgi:hypothetical protein